MGMSQTELGNLLGARSSRCRNEKGVNRVGAGHWRGRGADVRVSFFFGGTVA